MNWVDKKIEDIKKALEEVEKSELTSQTKLVVLNTLKNELNLLNAQKLKIQNDMDFVENGFKK